MIAIINAKVITVTNGIIEGGSVIVENGKIIAVGKNIEIPSNAQVIDAKGYHLTPGLIDAHTHISNFSEPQTLPTTMVDGNEYSNPITPTVRAEDALNPYDPAIEKVRAAGFTTCCTLPGSSNVIGGTGIVYKLRGNTAQKMIIPNTQQMKMALGENPKRVFGSQDKKMPITRMGVAAILRETLYDAKVYSDALRAAETDPTKAPTPSFKMDSLVPVIRGEMKCRIHCHRSDDIMTAIKVSEEFGLDYAIEHGTEGFKIADELASRGVFVTVGPLLLGPMKQELWDATIENSGILANAGVRLCLTADTGSKTKYLCSEIGFAIANGLDEQKAYEGITIEPARLLGVADRVGSIEVGKDADLALFNGYLFSNLTLPMLVMIDGVIYENNMA